MSDGSVMWRQVQEGWFLDVNHLARATPWLHTPLRLYAEYGVELFAGSCCCRGGWLGGTETCVA